MIRNILRALSVILLAGLPLSGALALDKPKGMILLTVAGNISTPNRGAMDPAVDKFTNGHDEAYDKAAVFDRAMLEKLGLHKVKASHPDWPEGFVLEGPRFADVLKAAGAPEKASVSITGMDGWTTEIDANQLAAENWIVALSDGKGPLALGQRGPAWIVFQPDDPDGAARTEEKDRWPWAVFFVRVK